MLPVTNKIILGTVQFGLEYGINNQSGKPGMDEVTSILDEAYNSGIRLLDTAEAYGNSQEVIGAYHYHSANRFEVITKFSPIRNDMIGHIQSQVIQDIHTLNIQRLYAYMFHSFRDFMTHYPGYKKDISEMKREGLIQKFGVSVYTNQEAESLLEFADIDLIQFPFNVLDNLNHRGELIDKAKVRGIEIHSRSVFLQGLVFKDPDNLPLKLKPLAPYLQRIRTIAEGCGLSINDLVLNYSAHQNAIDRVLIGVDSAEQLRECILSLKHEPSPEVFDRINTILVNESELLNPTNWK